MRRSLAALLMLIVLSGCAGVLGKVRKEQWEPDLSEPAVQTKPNDWTPLRKSKSKPEDPIDRWLWSDEAREINRNTGGGF